MAVGCDCGGLINTNQIMRPKILLVRNDSTLYKINMIHCVILTHLMIFLPLENILIVRVQRVEGNSDDCLM